MPEKTHSLCWSFRKNRRLLHACDHLFGQRVALHPKKRILHVGASPTTAVYRMLVVTCSGSALRFARKNAPSILELPTRPPFIVCLQSSVRAAHYNVPEKTHSPCCSLTYTRRLSCTFSDLFGMSPSIVSDGKGGEVPNGFPFCQTGFHRAPPACPRMRGLWTSLSELS